MVVCKKELLLWQGKRKTLKQTFMKKLVVYMSIIAMALLVPLVKTHAQDPITIVIKEGIKKVIKAVDLKIQRLQNQTIWLQNAQKVIENTMSKLKLDEITDWVEKQRSLYKDYFEELWKVKNVIVYYHRVKEIAEKQVRLIEDYKKAWALFRKDKHFSPEEIVYMGKVFKGILDESVKNLDQVLLVIHSFSTQMTDAQRMQIIDTAAEKIEANYTDLKAFNQQGILLSLQRAKANNEIEAVKQLYGIK